MVKSKSVHDLSYRFLHNMAKNRLQGRHGNIRLAKTRSGRFALLRLRDGGFRFLNCTARNALLLPGEHLVLFLLFYLDEPASA